MTEFSSKKIVAAIVENTTTLLFSGEDEVSSSSSSSNLFQKVVQWMVKGQELQQDFVAYGRSSATKRIWIGIGLCVMIALFTWILTKKIRLLV